MVFVYQTNLVAVKILALHSLATLIFLTLTTRLTRDVIRDEPYNVM